MRPLKFLKSNICVTFCDVCTCVTVVTWTIRRTENVSQWMTWLWGALHITLVAPDKLLYRHECSIDWCVSYSVNMKANWASKGKYTVVTSGRNFILFNCNVFYCLSGPQTIYIAYLLVNTLLTSCNSTLNLVYFRGRVDFFYNWYHFIVRTEYVTTITGLVNSQYSYEINDLVPSKLNLF